MLATCAVAAREMSFPQVKRVFFASLLYQPLLLGLLALGACSEEPSSAPSDDPSAAETPSVDKTPEKAADPVPEPTVPSTAELIAEIGETNQFGIKTHACCEVDAACCQVPGCCDLTGRRLRACMPVAIRLPPCCRRIRGRVQPWARR